MILLLYISTYIIKVPTLTQVPIFTSKSPFYAYVKITYSSNLIYQVILNCVQWNKPVVQETIPNENSKAFFHMVD